MKSRKLYFFFFTALLFIVLNPTMKQFKEFTEQPETVYWNERDARRETNPLTVVRRRTNNFLFFSFYEIGLADVTGKYTISNKYVGVLFNFFERS